MVREQRDAHARRRLEGESLQRDRRRQDPRDPLGHLDDRLEVRHPRQQDAELVSAEPGHGVLVAHDVAEPCSHLLQEQVAEVVSECVVHLLELVEVHNDDAYVSSGLPLAQRAPQPLGEEHAVRELGEDVVPGLVLDLALSQLELLGHELQRVSSREHLPGQGERGDEHDHGEERLVVGEEHRDDRHSRPQGTHQLFRVFAWLSP